MELDRFQDKDFVSSVVISRVFLKVQPKTYSVPVLLSRAALRREAWEHSCPFLQDWVAKVPDLVIFCE